MKNVLLTGATGFIGQKLVARLLDEGIGVTHIAPTEELARSVDGRAAGIVCSLDELESLAERLDLQGFDTLYHLAWDGVSTDYKNDYRRQFGNIPYCLNACRLAQAIGCGHVVIPGSVSEYAHCDDPVDGSLQSCPADAYGAAKAMARIACDLYARQNGLALNWLLVSSVYGPGRADANVITYSIRSLLSGVKPSYTALEQRWDYLYIDDLIEALYRIGLSGKPGQVYAIGSGDIRRLKDCVLLIRDRINPEAEVGIGEISYKMNRVDNSLVDISALQNDTGFHAAVDFEEGISKTIAYFDREQREN